jgi:TRAP-type C4-dicarboxylate transport system permease small subunit
MIRVTLVIDKLPDRAVRILEFVVATIGFLMVSGLSIFLFRNMAKDWDRGAVSNSVAEIPLWIPGLIAFVGATLLAAQLLMRALGTAVGPYERETHSEEVL